MKKTYYNIATLYSNPLRIRALTLLCFFLLPLFPLLCSAAVIEVPEDYPFIQEAIDASFDGDEIIVSPDTYEETLYFAGKNIILRSTEPTDPSVVASTIIDGNYYGSVVTFAGTELTSCVLSGFTITKGYALRGSGIYGNGTLATIQHNNITNNGASGSYPEGIGGGLHSCDGTIQNNTIEANWAHPGGGCGLAYCGGTIQNNVIISNKSDRADGGGGLAYCDATIQNNTISDNLAMSGGGLYDCDGTIQSNTISNNTAYRSEGGGGLALCDGTIQDNTISDNLADYNGGGLKECHGTIENNIIQSNLADSGGGLRSCDGTIRGNTISDNSAYYNGGGLSSCEGTIQNNTISGNWAYGNGGGLDRCGDTILNNAIKGNSAYHNGGGLSDCYGTIQNNTISGNWAEFGGGLYRCAGTLQNNLIWDNSAVHGGALSEWYGAIENNTIYGNSAWGAGGGLFWCPNETIRNCIIWQNTASTGAQLFNCATPSYSCIQDWDDGGTGNISDDPQLLDPNNGDFHLLPDSPCIDAGCYIDGLTADFEGDPRPYDGTPEPRGDGSDYDIGADEFIGAIPTPTPTPMEGELCEVIVADTRILNIAGDYEFLFSGSSSLTLSGTFTQDCKGWLTFAGTIIEDDTASSITTTGKLRVKKKTDEVYAKLKPVSVPELEAKLKIALVVKDDNLELTIKNKETPPVITTASVPLVCTDRGARIVIEEMNEIKLDKKYKGSGTLILPNGIEVPVIIKEKAKQKKDDSIRRNYKIKGRMDGKAVCRLGLRVRLSSPTAETMELQKVTSKKLSYVKKVDPATVTLVY